MSKIERFICVATMLYLGVSAILWIGREYFALLAVFELLVGVIIGMCVFMGKCE